MKSLPQDPSPKTMNNISRLIILNPYGNVRNPFPDGNFLGLLCWIISFCVFLGALFLCLANCLALSFFCRSFILQSPSNVSSRNLLSPSTRPPFPSLLHFPPANLRLRGDRLGISIPPKLLLAKQRSQFNGRSRSVQGISDGSRGTRFIELWLLNCMGGHWDHQIEGIRCFYSEAFGGVVG